MHNDYDTQRFFLSWNQQGMGDLKKSNQWLWQSPQLPAMYRCCHGCLWTESREAMGDQSWALINPVVISVSKNVWHAMQLSLANPTIQMRPKLVGKASIKLSDKLIGPTNTNHTLFFSSLLYSGWQGSMAMDSVASNALDNITITNWTNSCSHGAGKY